MELRKFRPDIEGLRALSVIAVVLAHSGWILPGGFVGVDVFFVISGYLITGHLYKELLKKQTIALKDFYAKRILRILPASTFVLLMTLLICYFFLSPLQLLSYGYDALFSALSVINYSLAINGIDYFNTATTPTPFQHYWSLAVEEQFYLLWPLIILIITKLTGGTKNAQKTLSVFLSILIVISFVSAWQLTSASQPWAYFGLATRAWQLALGALVAININLFAKIPGKIATVMSWFGLASLVSIMLFLDESRLYPDFWAIFPTLSAVLMMIAGINYQRFSAEILFNNPVVQFIGKVSYSWYLIHWPLFIWLFYTVGEEVQTWQRIVIIVGSLGLAALSHHFIENPIRFNPILKTNLGETFTLGIGLILLSSCISGGIIFVQSKPTDLPPKVVQISTGEQDLIKKVTEATKQEEFPSKLQGSLQTVTQDLYRSCISTHVDKNLPTKDSICILGKKDADKSIVLIGDSHAHQWAKTFVNLAEKYSYKLYIYTKAGCSFMDIDILNSFLKRDYTECYAWRKEALKQISEIKPDITVTTSLTYKNSTPEIYRTYLETLKANSKFVVNILDTPHPLENIPECLLRNQNNMSKCGMIQGKAIYAPSIRNSELDVAKDLGLTVIDPIPWFCFNKFCPAVIDNIIVYFDSSHISNEYASYLTPLIENGMKSVLETT